MTGDRRTHFAFTVGLLTVLGVGALVPPLLWADRLPEPLATHWGLSGRPDDEMSRSTFLAGLVIVSLGLAIAVGVTAVRRKEPRLAVVGPLAFVGGLAASVSSFTVWANLDAAHWTVARSVSWAALLALIAFPIGLAVGANWLEGRAWPSAGLWEHPAADLPSAGIVSGEGATWTGTCTSRWGVPLTFGSAVLALVFGATGAWALGVPLLTVTLTSEPFTLIRVHCGSRGMVISYGWFGWPTTRIALADISRATVIDIHPAEWGGYGYRGSRRVFRRAAVVLRRGEGIRLDIADGTVFAVTVDDAATGAGVLNDLLRGLRQREVG